MANYKIYEGDSLWVDVVAASEEVLAIDADWTNFSGVWRIKAALSDPSPICQGNLTRTTTAGTFRFNLTTANSALLAAGAYQLVYQIDNVAIDYREEIHDKITVQAQGVLP